MGEGQRAQVPTLGQLTKPRWEGKRKKGSGEEGLAPGLRTNPWHLKCREGVPGMAREARSNPRAAEKSLHPAPFGLSPTWLGFICCMKTVTDSNTTIYSHLHISEPREIYIYIYIYTHTHVFFFNKSIGLHLWPMEGPRLGVELEL